MDKNTEIQKTQEAFEEIKRKYPKLYPENFFFELGSSGWIPLVQELSQKLYPYTEKHSFWASQVKQKFGGLRFYIVHSIDEKFDEEIYDIIEDFESKSYTVCEVCGNPGKPQSGGWIYTLCEEHHNGS